MRSNFSFFVLCFAVCNATQVFSQDKLVIRPNHADGIYAVGESVTWNIEHLTKESSPPSKPLDLEYRVLQGGLNEFKAGKLEIETNGEIVASRNEPGVLLLSVRWKSEDGRMIESYGGAVFAPEQIKISAPAPEDFDEFWKDKIAELDKVPMQTEIEQVDLGDSSIEYYHITMNNIRGKKIYGQLAKPADGKDLPATLQVQWAGVYPLHPDWVKWQAKNGWLAFNISAHDLPIDKPNAFYEEKAKEELNDYPGQGNEDRETSYFLPMFLSCRRAVDFLTQREDWNGETLVVHGGSQGGYQAIVTAGLHPAVTAFAANVPAGCDHTGVQAGRAPGWPQWASRTWQGKDATKMLKAARYFDAMNFARRFKGTALVGIGLVDTVCPAEGAIATYNNLAGPKHLVIMPEADHGGDHRAYQTAFEDFMKQQKPEVKVGLK